MSIVTSFYQFGNSSSGSPSPPPSGNFPSYLSWTFDNEDFADTSGTYTFIANHNYYFFVAGFPSSGKALHMPSATLDLHFVANIPQLQFSWDLPFAITAWYRIGGAGFYNELSYYKSDSTDSSEQVFRLRLGNKSGTQRHFMIDSEQRSYGGIRTAHTWIFNAFRYNPTNNRQIDVFDNGAFLQSLSFSSTVNFPSSQDYAVNQRLVLAPNRSNNYIDQLTIWTGTVLTDENISTLWNDGNGITLSGL